MTEPHRASETAPSGIRVCADLDVEHAPGVSLVWAAQTPCDLHPVFSPPLGRLAHGLQVGGKAYEAFGVYAIAGEADAEWGARRAQAAVWFPRYSEEQKVELSEDEVDAMYNEPVVALRPADPGIRAVVSRAPRAATLRGTLERALARRPESEDGPLSRFAGDEGLILPVVQVDAGEIRARFDQGGEGAPSVAVSQGLMSAPRRFVLVPPFLIAVVTADRGEATFALWVEGSAALVAR